MKVSFYFQLKLDFQNGASISDYGLKFYNPDNSDIELIEGGKDKEVTLTNINEYLEMIV